MTLLYELLALVGLILLNGFFVASEYGLVTSRKTRIAELEQSGNKRARAVQRITADPPQFISVGGGWSTVALGPLIGVCREKR